MILYGKETPSPWHDIQDISERNRNISGHTSFSGTRIKTRTEKKPVVVGSLRIFQIYVAKAPTKTKLNMRLLQ